MKIHPIANEYPDYPAAEFQALKASIKENGLVSPITVDENGAIIDGRHRYLACTELGLKCETVTFKGTEDEKKKRALVLNYFRRHLTQSQRNQVWLALAEIATLPHGTNQFTGSEDPSRDGSSQKLTVKEASEKSGLSETSIERGKYVVANGIPELIAAIKEGKLTEYPAWKIAKLTKKEQRALAKKGFKEDRKPRKVKTATPVEQKQPQQPVEEKTADPQPEVKLTHVEQTHIEMLAELDEMIQQGFKKLRTRKDWSETVEQKKAVERFLRSVRNVVSLFERHAIAESDPDVHEDKSEVALFPDAAKEKADRQRTKPTEAEFEAFWKVFPCKVKKPDTKKAFTKAFALLRKKNTPSETIDIIMRGASVYAERANPETLSHPTTWLNACRWDDDPDSIWPKGSNKKTGAGEYGKFNGENASFEDELKMAMQ